MTKTAAEILDGLGIRLRSHREGNQKVCCPRCSHQRKNKKDPCLSVLVDSTGVRYCCHNCNFEGGEYYDSNRIFEKQPFRQRPNQRAVRAMYR